MSDRNMQDNENKLDKWDVMASVASGSLTAAMDILWTDTISFSDAHSWGTDKVNNVVLSMAKKSGYKGNDLAGAVKKLEEVFPMAGDKLTAEFGGGGAHHLRDFSHHPTPVGLVFSIIMNMTGVGYGTDTAGNFVSYQIKDWVQMDPARALYNGTVGWMMHIVSDIAGSSGTLMMGKEGTSLPGPLLSALKEISAMPGIKNIAGKNDKDNYEFSVACSKLFNGTLLGGHDENGKIIKGEQLRFDLRTELGITNEIIKNKQYIPVLLNTVFVSAFYSIRRFAQEIKEKNIDCISKFNEIDVKKCLPFNNDSIRHMRMISAATFSTIDLSAAGIKAAIKNKNNPTGFALDFMQSINYLGLGSLALSANSELIHGIQKLYGKFEEIANQQKERFISGIDGNTVKLGMSTAASVVKMGTPIGFVAATVGVYSEVTKAIDELQLARSAREKVERECAQNIRLLEENRMHIDQIVSEYLTNRMLVFAESFDVMDRAITEDDVDAYILGNNMIQHELGYSVLFDSMEEFDELMMSDDALVL